MKDFSYLKPGDKVTRLISSAKIPMEVTVGIVEDGLIYCGAVFVQATKEEGWCFRVENGAEVDHELGWDGITSTGSVLKHNDE